MGRSDVFSEGVRAILGAGTSLIVGTVGDDGEPRATRAFALEIIDDDAGLVRVVVSADDPMTREHLRTGRIAVTAADVRTLRSVQLKGRVQAVEPTSPHDQEMADEHSALFFEAVHQTDGDDPAKLRRILPLTTVSVEFVVDELFDQSPGPSAGHPVTLAR